jgi:hypothetical protein
MPTLDEHSKIKLPPKTLIYGDPKTGKTTQVGKLAATRKLVFLENEGGAKSLLAEDNLKSEYRKNINLIDFPDTKTYPISSVTIRRILSMPVSTVFNLCHAHGSHNCPKCKAAKLQFSPFSIQKDVIESNAILVIDSLGQLTSSYIEYIRADANRDLVANLTALDLDKPETINKFKDDEKFNFDDWNHLGNLCCELLQAIQAAPYEVIAITHPSMVKHEDGSTRLTPSMGSDKFTVKVARHFDNVIYAEIKLGKYVYSSVPTMANAIVGSRYGIDISKVDMKKHYSILEPFHPIQITS